MLDCSLLRDLSRDTYTLLMYLGYLRRSILDEVCEVTRMHMRDVLETRCGGTVDSLRYLLQFTDELKSTYIQIILGRLYVFQMTGVSSQGKASLFTNHTFVLFPLNLTDSLIVDSYLGCRKFTCRTVRTSQIIQHLQRLYEKYTPEDWKAVTECPSMNDIGVDQINIEVSSYRYTSNSDEIRQRFLSLLTVAEERFLLSSDNFDLLGESPHEVWDLFQSMRSYVV